MMMDSIQAYSTLGIEESASVEQIRHAYHRLALTVHPDRNANDNGNAEFLQIKEAYQLLLFVKEISIEPTEFTKIQQLPSIELELKLTLEELFNGCVKQQNITRVNIDQNGDETSEEIELTIRIKAGTLPGTRIVFEKKGNFQYGKEQADVIFIVIEEEHPHFRRHRFDLHYTAQVASEDVLFGCQVQVPSLDDEEDINLEVNEMILLNHIQIVPNKGLPIPNCLHKRGNLVVTFEIIYEPTQNEDHCKEIEFTEEFNFFNVFGNMEIFSD